MGKKHTVLVVDDEQDVVKSVQDLLRLDYRVLGATSAKEGLRILQGEEVHVVMTDQRMPEMTGVQFLHQIRGEHPEAIRLLFTGYADIRAVIDAINEGNVYRYIVKPWDPEELQTVIREATERFDLLVERQMLLDTLKEKNVELEVANAELRKIDELKTAFIQVASHELRSPLTTLLGMTQLANMTPNLTAAVRDWLARITRAGQRLSGIVDQITTMLLVGHYERPLERQPVDVHDLLNDAVEDVRPFAKLRNQTIITDFGPSIGSMPLEAPKIRDALNHLLMNAIKFTPDEGTITVSATRGADKSLTMIIADDGVGIDPDLLPKVFTPFLVSSDVSHHSSGHFEFGRKGIGLGLSTVKAFVTMHGGTIDLVSQPGKGTTFTIRLPDAS